MLVLLLVFVVDQSAPAAPHSGPIRVKSHSAPVSPIVEVATYRINTIARARTVYSLPKGPRTIQRVEWRASADSSEWRTARLRLSLDEETDFKQIVDLPLHRFFDQRKDSTSPTEPPGTWINEQPRSYLRGGHFILDTKGPVQGTFRVISIPGLIPLKSGENMKHDRTSTSGPIEESRPAKGARSIGVPPLCQPPAC